MWCRRNSEVKKTSSLLDQSLVVNEVILVCPERRGLLYPGVEESGGGYWVHLRSHSFSTTRVGYHLGAVDLAEVSLRKQVAGLEVFSLLPPNVN